MNCCQSVLFETWLQKSSDISFRQTINRTELSIISAVSSSFWINWMRSVTMPFHHPKESVACFWIVNGKWRQRHRRSSGIKALVLVFKIKCVDGYSMDLRCFKFFFFSCLDTKIFLLHSVFTFKRFVMSFYGKFGIDLDFLQIFYSRLNLALHFIMVG